MLHNINSKYDADGDFEENYRNVKKKIYSMTRSEDQKESEAYDDTDVDANEG